MKTFRTLIFFTFIFFLQATICAKELKKVTLQLSWFDQFQFAGYYMAKEKGFYEELGLDVEILPFSYDKNIVKNVNDGEIDFAVGRENLILEKSKYQNIKVLAAIFQAPPLVVLSLKSSNIEQIKDFENKKVMSTKDDAEEVSLNAMLYSKKISNSSLKFIPHSHNIQDLIDKKTDLITAYSSKAPFFLEKQNIAYNSFAPKDYNFDMYSDFLYTNNRLIEKDPNLVLLFKNASLRGWEYAYSHSKESVDLIFNKYNSQNLSKKELSFEANELMKLSYYKTSKLGEITEEKLRRIYDLYNIMGLVDKKIDLDDFIFKPKDTLILSDDEKNYLQRKEILNICMMSNYMPFSDIIDGKFVGLVADYTSLLEDLIKKPIKLIKTNSWENNLGYFYSKKCDILPMIIKTKEREEHLYFTKSYLSLPFVLTTKSNERFISSLKEVKNKKISIVKDYAFINEFKDRYKNIEFVEVKDLEEGLQKVLKDDTYGHIDFLQNSWYQIQTKYMSKLQISAKLDINEDISMAVLKENELLSSILNKSLMAIDKISVNEILNKWILKDGKKESNYSLFLQILGVVLIFFAVGIYRQHLLTKGNKRLKYLVNLKTRQLKNVNKRLANRIKKELEKNLEKDRILAQQQKMVSMGQMIENIAHQWRQPLSLISTNASTLKLKKELNILGDSELIKISEQIVKTSNYLSQTIDDFRYFFKPQKEKEYFDFDICIKKCLELIEDNFVQNRIKIICETQNIKIFGYESELIQVLINILNNSKDAMLQKEIEEMLIFIKLTRKNKKVYLEIYDNAGGIKDEILDKIFEPYFTTKHQSSGTGIGLYMSQQIITMHMKGEIFMENYKFAYNQKDYFGAKLTIILDEANTNV